ELVGVDIRVEDVVAGAPVHSGDFLRSWVSLAELSDVDGNAKKVLLAARSSLMERGEFEQMIRSAAEWFEKLQKNKTALGEGAFDDYESEKLTWSTLQQDITSEQGRENLTLHSLLQGFDLRSKEPPEPRDAIRCYTIHLAKGLEFRHVYLMGVVEDQLPSWSA